MDSILAQSPLGEEKAEEQMLGSASPINHVSCQGARGMIVHRISRSQAFVAEGITFMYLW